MAPPQEWCCSCWWNRNQLSGAPPRDGLVSHPYAKSWISSQIVLFLVALNSWTQAYRVKTPAARPILVSLALCSASPSDSNDSTDMTGPKISSFTQVMSSVQFAATKEKYSRKVDTLSPNLTHHLWHCSNLTQYARSHVVSTSEFGICWYKRFPSTQHHRSLEISSFLSSSEHIHVWWLKQRAGFTSFFAWSTKERTLSKWALLTRAPIRVLSSRGSPILIAQVLFTTSSTNSWRIFLWTKTRVPLLQTCDEQNNLMSALLRWPQISVTRCDVYLALGQEIGHESSPHGILQISILKDDERRFTPELQSHWLHSLRGHRHNLERERYINIYNITMMGGHGFLGGFWSSHLLSCGHTPSEGNLVNIWVSAEQPASLLAALHHIEEPLRDSSLSVHLCQHDGSHRGHRWGLKHHGVAFFYKRKRWVNMTLMGYFFHENPTMFWLYQKLTVVPQRGFTKLLKDFFTAS